MGVTALGVTALGVAFGPRNPRLVCTRPQVSCVSASKVQLGHRAPLCQKKKNEQLVEEDPVITHLSRRCPVSSEPSRAPVGAHSRDQEIKHTHTHTHTHTRTFSLFSRREAPPIVITRLTRRTNERNVTSDGCRPMSERPWDLGQGLARSLPSAHHTRTHTQPLPLFLSPAR